MTGNQSPSGVSDTAAGLSGRSSRASFWFLFFLFFTPLSFVIPCAIGIALSPDKNSGIPPQGFTITQAFGMAAVILPLVGLCGLILMWNDRRKYKKSLGAAQSAAAMGFDFAVKPDAALMQHLMAFRLFSDADEHFGDNCCTGTFQGKRVALLEFATAFKRGGGFSLAGRTKALFSQYSNALAKGTSPVYGKLNNQTVVLVFDLDYIPAFRVGPFGWIDDMARSAGAQLLRMPEERKFDERFSIWADSTNRSFSPFTPQVIDLILDSQDATIEVRGRLLAYFRHRQTVPPDRYPELISEAVKIARALEEAAGLRGA